MAGKISLKTMVAPLFIFGITAILSACINPIDMEKFMQDDKVKEIAQQIDAANNPKVVIDKGSDDFDNLVAGNGSISGLTPGKYYMFDEYYDGDLTRSRFIKADGDNTATLTDIGKLEGSKITNLKNNLTYKVKAVKPFDSTKTYEYFSFGDTSATPATVSSDSGVTTAAVAGTDKYLDLGAVINPAKLYEVMMFPPSADWGAASRTSASYKSNGLNIITNADSLYNDKYNANSEIGVYQYKYDVFTGGAPTGLALINRSIIKAAPGDFIFAEYSNKSTERRTVTNFVFIHVEVNEAQLPPLTGTVSITVPPPAAEVVVGKTLTANTALDGTGIISYQWKRGGAEIAGATAGTYQLVNADAGANITVTVTRAGNSGSKTSDAVGPVVYPALAGSVSIVGTPKVGETLRANTDALVGSGAIIYQWRRDPDTNVGSNTDTYKLVKADEGKTITLTVTCAENTGSKTATTSTVAPSGVTIADIGVALNWANISGVTPTITDNGTAYTAGVGPKGGTKLDIMLTASGGTTYTWYHNGTQFSTDAVLTLKYALYDSEPGYTENAAWFQTGTHVILLVTDKGSASFTFER